MSTEAKNRGQEVLSDLKDKTAAVLQETTGLDHKQAQIVAHAVANHMRKEWGGQLIYFTKSPLEEDVAARDLEIYADFSGSNHEALAKKYDMSVQWIYQIVKKVQRYELARRQADMFGDTQPDER